MMVPSFAYLRLSLVAEVPVVVFPPGPVLDDEWGRPCWMGRFLPTRLPFDLVDLHLVLVLDSGVKAYFCFGTVAGTTQLRTVLLLDAFSSCTPPCVEKSSCRWDVGSVQRLTRYYNVGCHCGVRHS